MGMLEEEVCHIGIRSVSDRYKSTHCGYLHKLYSFNM